MKTIGFELSKRLTDLGLLDNIKTQYIIRSNGIIYKTYEFDILSKEIKQENGWGKTLTLEEVIEFLPYRIKFESNFYLLHFHKTTNSQTTIYYYDYYKWNDYNKSLFNGDINGITQIQAIEKMIEYLLDNNLLTN